MLVITINDDVITTAQYTLSGVIAFELLLLNPQLDAVIGGFCANNPPHIILFVNYAKERIEGMRSEEVYQRQQTWRGPTRVSFCGRI